MAKSLLLTYILWLIGGFWGLHHLYLGRDEQALVWVMFAGGYFGLGWLRDLWRIPEYVQEANGDSYYIEKLVYKMRKYPTPPSSTVRYCGMMIVADAFGYLVLAAIPEELLPEFLLPFSTIFVPLAVALGVYLVGNIGQEEGDFWMPLIGAYLTYPLYFWKKSSVFWTSVLSCAAFNRYAKKWRRSPRRQRSIFYRLFIFLLCILIYASLWCSWLYFNCSFTDKEGQEIYCREAIKNFLTSPLWNEFKKVMKDVYNFAQHHGWWEIWHQLIHALDPLGEKNALQVLNLTRNATQEEISAQYRKLSRQWHPDRHKDPEEKQNAQEKFIEIQQAYEVLSDIKSRRVRKNKKAQSTSSSEL
ncbi:dnaJ homolog subfamily C member 22-like [Centruroides sculpturatus]|uniref:dnaJ homolog subfamily C member 22-like n=1 Tax=Centruroides sculpturatus TaxID=218467 RepID=UPI000C6EA913|nr:dnaJ homolog subfamily C member 22-like [Centruroides sculpturatus]